MRLSADYLQLTDPNSEMIRSEKQANFILQSGCESKQQLFKFLMNLDSPLNLGHSHVAALLTGVLSSVKLQRTATIRVSGSAYL